MKWYFCTIVVFLFISSCKEEDKPVDFGLTPVHLDVPAHFPILEYPAENPPSKERIELGRALYYDDGLARADNLVGMACASCHQQANSFSSDKRIAVLPHVNLAWASYFLWNGAKDGKLEDVMEFELSEFFNADIGALASNEQYNTAFKKAFEDGAITTENAAMALAQFVRSMISAESKFDKFLSGEVELSEAEQRGYEVFNSERGDCFHCHSIPLMTDNSFHNIGLVDKFKDHLGRYAVTKRTIDVGAFKTPTLRNVELTAPYMHDDRFATLEEVIEHYNSGVLPSPSLDPIMTKAGKETGLHLTDQEKSALKAFLLTLTDEKYVQKSTLGPP